MTSYDRSQGYEEDTISIVELFDDIWKAIRKFWLVILVLLILGTGIGYIKGLFFTTEVYEASATYLVESLEASLEERDQKTLGQQVYSTFAKLFETTNYQQQLIYLLGTNELPGKVTVEVMEASNFVTFKAQANNPNTAYQLLQDTISIYPDYAVYVVGKIQLQLMDDMGVPQQAMNANRVGKSALAGGLIAAIVCCWIIGLYIYLRKTIVRPDDLKKYMSSRYLGSIPKVVFKKRSTPVSKLIELQNEHIPPEFTESFYTVANRLEKEAKEHHIKSILVTSAIPGEGKTTFAYNLALSLGLKGKKVILIDADLRHPSQTRMRPQVEVTDGLDTLLKGKTSLNKVIYQDKDLPIDMIFVKKNQVKASELIASEGFSKMMKSLEEEYEYIILDTPPAAMLSDAAVIGKCVDGVVFLVKQDYAKAKHIVEGVNLLAENQNLWFLGCVLNQVSLKANIPGMGYGYGSRYYGNYKRLHER